MELNPYFNPGSLVKYDEAVEKSAKDQMFDGIDENVVMKALDGFLIILSKDGDVIYVSENIHEYIGINQVCSEFEVRFFPPKFAILIIFFLIENRSILSAILCWTTYINAITLNYAIFCIQRAQNHRQPPILSPIKPTVMR